MMMRRRRRGRGGRAPKAECLRRGWWEGYKAVSLAMSRVWGVCMGLGGLWRASFVSSARSPIREARSPKPEAAFFREHTKKHKI